MLNNVVALLGNGAAAGGGASFESIASATGTGSSGTITFSSIPSTYKHLQIRGVVLSATNYSTARLRLNGDSGTNYATHQLYGDGSAATATNDAPINFSWGIGYSGTFSTNPMVGIIDIHDYTSTTRNKTIRNFSGIDKNGSGDVILSSGVWLNTSAVTSVTLFLDLGNYSTTTQIALYGIKGA